MSVTLIIIFILIGFYLWMFWDMANNVNLPNNPTLTLRWPPVSKMEWTLIFVILNVAGAGFYYLSVYRQR